MKKFLPFLGLICTAGIISCQGGTTPKLIVEEKFEPQSEKLDLSKEGLISQLDVLFVVDDSGSMDDKQRLLASNIALFTQEFTKSAFVDYHVGVITSSAGGSCGTAPCNGNLVAFDGKTKWIQRGTPNAVKTLQENFMVGINGDATEKFFEPTRLALSAPVVNNENKGFYRQRGHLAVIFVTDTDDQSNNFSPDQFIDFLKKLKGGMENFSVYGAYIPSNDKKCSRSGEGLPIRLEEVFTKTKASTVNLCDPQFGKELAKVGKDLFHRVARKMYLSRRPVEGSIKVTYGSMVLPNDADTGWLYSPSENVIKFGNKVNWESQPQGANLEIEYTPMPEDAN